MTEEIARILVPVDFGAHSGRALRYAAFVARQFGASVQLLHVVEDPFLTGAWTEEISMATVPELLEQQVAEARRRLTAILGVVAAEGVSAEAMVVRGHPAQEIVAIAQSGRFDLIVMGTHGRTGLSHVFLGSVAERVVRRAPCPVLTMRETIVAAEREPLAAAAATA